MESAQFIHAKVSHSRQVEAKHKFKYSVPFLFFDVSTVDKVQETISKKTFGLYNFKAKDYLNGKSGDLEHNIKSFLISNTKAQADQIFLISSPRTFGYVFNPISFWLCKINGEYRSALVEVNNTFGERHYYWIDENRPLNSPNWFKVSKAFYVSPFMKVEGYYKFKFSVKENSVDISINYFSDTDRLKLSTSIKGSTENLAEISFLKTVIKYGPASVLITFRIHFQALRLYIKSVSLKAKPTKGEKDVTS